MDRRSFMTLATVGMLAPVAKLVAEHHVVSADPLMVDFDLQSLEGRYTSVEDFYVRNHRAIPENLGTGFLQVEGEDATPKRLSHDELVPLHRRELGAVLECAGNLVGTVGKVSSGVWEGWSLGDVLTLAQPALTGSYLHLFGRDGYARSVPVGRAYEDGMLVTRLNGRPLGRQHGAPWRALFPGWYGMDSVKWLERIVISKTPLPSNDNAYLELKPGASGEIERRPLPRVQVKSVILSPSSGAVLRRGKVEAHGLAWSGEGKISAVEVSGNGGTSWSAAIVDLGSWYEWALWRSELELSQRGSIEFLCRATDEKSSAQPAQRDPQRLDGYANNWYHRVRCVAI